MAEIVSRLTQPSPPDQAKSIGVVTFNSEQQTLIENLLDERAPPESRNRVGVLGGDA